MSGIRKESVNYVGYYSQHEETMKALIQNQAKAGWLNFKSCLFFLHLFINAGEDSIRRIVTGAMVDCRREFLWQKLLDSSPFQHALTHVEFMELISLVHHETLDNVSPIKYHVCHEQVNIISKVLKNLLRVM